ncbi:MAG: hypothetical protein KC416_10590 [Myxococcales bacterium]|nr:hypothetical protein [Myxococcales bacterium]
MPLLFLAGLLVGLFVLGLSDVRAIGSRPRRRVLLALRVAGLVLGFAVVVQPRLRTEKIEYIPGRLALALDGSLSMSVARRQEAVRAFLDERGEELSDVTVFAVGDGVVGADVSQYAPTAGESHILEDMTGLALDADQGHVSSMLLLSDGIDTSKDPSLDALRGSGLRVHTAWVPGDSLDDDAITRVRADPVAFLRQESLVRVWVRSSDPSIGELQVILDHRGELVSKGTAVLVDGVGTVELRFTPRALGRTSYRVSIPVRGRDAVPENNGQSVLVQVERDRLRVLHVAGRPSWDQRFLREFLKKDPTIDLISFFILRNNSDLTLASPEEMALIPFPTEELFADHLDSFDLVIFQNFDYGPYGMARHLPRIRDYVLGGGSFAMLGGELSFSAGGYAGTPLESILPVTLPVSAGEGSLLYGRFLPRVPEGIEGHPLVALRGDPAATHDLWSSLAPLDGLNRVEAVAPGATVLLTHPTQRLQGGEPVPVLLLGKSEPPPSEGLVRGGGASPADKGRVLALMTDTSWHWGMVTGGTDGDPSTYALFWDRALRWLARDPSLEPSRLSTDRDRVGPGAELVVEGIARVPSYVPVTTPVEVVVVDPDGHPLGDPIIVRPDARGEFRGRLRAPSPVGAYRLSLRGGDGQEWAEEWFLVEDATDELADLAPRSDMLSAMSEATGARAFRSLDEVPSLSELREARRRVGGQEYAFPLATWPVFLLFVCLWGLEWWLRRRWGRR